MEEAAGAALAFGARDAAGSATVENNDDGESLVVGHLAYSGGLYMSEALGILGRTESDALCTGRRWFRDDGTQLHVTTYLDPIWLAFLAAPWIVNPRKERFGGWPTNTLGRRNELLGWAPKAVSFREDELGAADELVLATLRSQLPAVGLRNHIRSVGGPCSIRGSVCCHTRRRWACGDRSYDENPCTHLRAATVSRS